MSIMFRLRDLLKKIIICRRILCSHDYAVYVELKSYKYYEAHIDFPNGLPIGESLSIIRTKKANLIQALWHFAKRLDKEWSPPPPPTKL